MKKRPNILIFMTDQQHAETIGQHGLCQTPNLNALMRDGITFSQAYTSCPMCTPARASALTGMHPHQHRMLQNSHSPLDFQKRLDPHIDTIATALSREGYRTVYAGKWHIGDTAPTLNGFDQELDLNPKPTDYAVTDQVMIQDRQGEHTLAATASYDYQQSGVFQLSEAVNNWIDREATHDQPFFMFASCLEPHVPWIVPEPYASMYDPTSMQTWDNYDDDYTDKPLTYRKHYSNVNFCRIQHDWSSMSRALAKYYGTISMIDDAFGTIIHKLDQQGLLEDTIILFTSDHGECMGRHGLIGKNELAIDDIIRVPLVAYWKSHWANKTCDQLVTLTDLFNTVMELTKTEIRTDLDSHSFVPALLGQSFRGHDYVIVQHHGATINLNTIRAIRTAEYKYVYRAHEIDELYDLRRDPGEMINRVHDPEYHDRLWELREQLLDWARRNRDFALRGMEQSFVNFDGGTIAP
jgi:arylsulfatase A-like enzyme